MALDEDEVEAPKTVAAPNKRSPYPIMAGAIVLLSVIGGAVFIYRAKSSVPVADVTVPQENVVMIEDPDNVLTGAVLSLGSFVVNLGSPDTFLKTKISVEFFDFELTPEMQSKMPGFRDAIIEVLGRKKAGELLTDTGKSRVRLELVDALNKIAGDSAKVVNVYFTEFVVQ